MEELNNQIVNVKIDEDSPNDVIRIKNVKKQYRLGAIGGATLREDLQSWWARVRGKEDPNMKIGAKQYKKGEKFLALNNVSFNIRKQERIGIIGRNGAGKSTLLKLLSRVTAPTEGEIYMKGRIASMLEVGTGFHGELTGRENVYMNGSILGMTKAEIDSKMDDIIEFSEIGEFIDTPVKRYSSGMYVKLAFSVAAHLNSEIMIMDEVLAVGDMNFQNKCIKKMRDVAINEGKTILYVSHNMNTIRELCDRCVVLSHGEMIYNGDVEKAISIYLGNEHSDINNTHYDFTEIVRNHHFGEKIFVKSFDILDKKTAIYQSNEKIYCEMNFKSNIKLSDVRVVIRIKNDNNVEKYISVLTDKFDVEKSENQHIRFAIDLSMLIDDVYCLSFEIIKTSLAGSYITYDNPGAMIRFKIADQINKELFWSKQYWGNVKMQNMSIEKF